jgi:hypothetical protein
MRKNTMHNGPSGAKFESMPSSEELQDTDDAALIAWTLWLRAGDLRRHALLAEDRAARGVARDSNAAKAKADKAVAARLLRLAGCPDSPVG